MANKPNRPEAAPEAARLPEQVPASQTIEALREKHRVSGPVFAGVCAANGWRPGRTVTEAAFLQAVAGFTGAAMGTRGERGSKK